jgi:hypothetical protein
MPQCLETIRAGADLGNNFNRASIEPRYRPPGQQWILGQRWIVDGGLRGGGPGRSPFWRTPKESCKGLGSVSLI